MAKKTDDNNENTLTLYETIRDRNGKKHRIYSARFKDLQTITDFTEKYNADSFGLYMLAPVVDEDGNVERDADGNINYNNGFLDDLMEIVDLALDHRETREQIEEWLDLDIAKEIVLTMRDIEELRINQLEDLLIGLGENAEEERKYIEGESGNGEVLEGDDAIHALLGDQ